MQHTMLTVSCCAWQYDIVCCVTDLILYYWKHYDDCIVVAPTLLQHHRAICQTISQTLLDKCKLNSAIMLGASTLYTCNTPYTSFTRVPAAAALLPLISGNCSIQMPSHIGTPGIANLTLEPETAAVPLHYHLCFLRPHPHNP